MLKNLINWFKGLFSKKTQSIVDNKIDIESIKISSKGKNISLTINGVEIPAEVTYEHSEEGELFGYFANGPGCYVVTLQPNEFEIIDASIWTSRKEGGNYIGVTLWLETLGPGVQKGYVLYEKTGTQKEIKHNKRSIKFSGELIAKTSRIMDKKVKLRGFEDGSHSIPVEFNLKW